MKQKIVTRTRIFFVLLISAILAVMAGIAWQDSGESFADASPPYPPSTLVKAVNWDLDNIIRMAPGSDLWPVTWGPDNNIYISWGDGGGFHGENRVGRVTMGFARIEGGPTDFTATNINGGAKTENPASWDCRNCGKSPGILFVDGILYTWVNLQNDNPPDLVLSWSDDMGATWQTSDWSFTGGSQFEPRTFLNFGPDYAGSRDNYVYSYGSDRADSSLLLLARTPRDQLTERSAYEFYAGKDSSGNPVWDKDMSKRQPVAIDPAGIISVAANYSPALGRYLLTTHMGSRVGRFGIFDGIEPWGPWTTIGYYNNWANLGDIDGSMPHSFPGKWISEDGSEMYMIFSGRKEWDSFNMVKLKLELHQAQE